MTDRYEPFTVEEELFRSSGRLPAVPAGLRERVLIEAAAAEGRRKGARRSAMLTGVLVVSVGLVLGLNPLPSVDDIPPRRPATSASTSELELDRSEAVALLTDRAGTIAMAGVGEWDQVEAFVLLRRAGHIVVSGTP